MSVEIDVQTRSDSADRDLKKINDSLNGIKKTTDSVTNSLGTMVKSLALGAFSLGSFGIVVKISDQFTDLGNKIALVTGRTKELVYAQQQLLDISEQTRGSIEGTATSFGVLGRSLKATGASTDSILKATRAVQQAVAISGASVEGANGALIQLGQGLGSGVLRGDEFNSVLEQTPRIIQAIADNLGLSIGQMRGLANEGKLTSDIVFKGLLSQTDKLNKEFALMAPTAGQGIQLIKQSTAEWVNELLLGLGASESLGTGLVAVAHGIRQSAKGIAVDAAIFAANAKLMLANVAVIAVPLISIFKSLGDQLVMAMPKVWFSRTLIGDTKYAFHEIDAYFNNFFSQTNRDAKYFLTDLFTFNTPVEKAIKQIRRLTTDAFSGVLSTGSLASFFNTNVLYQYGKAFRELAVAVQANSSGFFVAYRNFGRSVKSAFDGVLIYFGLISDTIVRIQVGAVDPLMRSFAQLIRGISGMQVKLVDFKRVIEELLGDTYIGVINALVDVLKVAPRALVQAAVSVFNALFATVDKVATALGRAWDNKFYGPVALSIIGIRKLRAEFDKFGSVTLGNNTFQDVISGAVDMARKAGTAIKDFSVKVIQYFFEIWDAVIGHSWWTDTVESVVNTSKSLLSDTRNGLTKFSDFVINTFKNIWSNVTGKYGWDDIITSMSDGADKLATNTKSGFDRFKAYIASGLDEIKGGSVDMQDRLKMGAVKHIGKSFLREIRYNLTYDPGAATKFQHWLDALTLQVPLQVYQMASATGKAIDSFANYVIKQFKRIWDEVIGHSWWTDTMDDVVSQSNSLLTRAKKGLDKFKAYVGKLFRELTGQASLGDKIGANFAGLGDILSNVADSFGQKLKKAFELLKTEAPEILKVMGLALAGFGLLFFPAGAIKTILVAVVGESILTATALIAEKFAGGLFGTSFIMSSSIAMGKVAGYFAVQFVKEIPQFVNALTGIASGFVQGFLSQIPLIGTALSGVLSAATVIGTAGPLGLIGAYFFGKSILPILANFKFMEKPLKLFAKFGAWVELQAAGTGILQRFLFGVVGPARMIAGVGLLLSSLGGFDSLFGDSVIGRTVTDGGLLFLLLYGDRARTIAADAIYGSIVTPLIAAVQSVSRRVSFGGTNLFDIIWGSSGPAFFASAKTWLTTAFKKVGDIVVEYGSTIGRRAIDIGKLFLFGSDPEQTTGKFKAAFQAAIDTIKNGFTKLGEFAKKSNFIKNLFEGDGGPSGIQKIIAKIKGIFTTALVPEGGEHLPEGQAGPGRPAGAPAEGPVNRPAGGSAGDAAAEALRRIREGTDGLERRAGEVGGETGILGRIFFGRYGKLVVVGLALLAFAGIASAAESTSQDIGLKNYSVFDGVMSNIKYYFKNDPIKAWLGTIGATTVAAFLLIPGLIRPAIMGVASLLATVLGPAFARMAAAIAFSFNAGPLVNLGGQAETLAASIGLSMAKIKSFTAAAAIGGGIGALVGGDGQTAAIFAGISVAAVQLFTMLPVAARASMAATIASVRLMSIEFIASFGTIGEAASVMWGYILGPIGLIIAATLGLGAVLTAVFGEGDTFGEKLDDVFRRMLVSLGLLQQGATVLGEKLEKAVPNNKRKFGIIDVEYSFKSVDFTKLDSGAKENATKLTEKLAEVVSKGHEEQDQFGEVSKITADNITTVNKQLNNYIKKLEGMSRKDINDSLGDANESNQTKIGLTDWSTKIKQSGLDKELFMAASKFTDILKTDQSNPAALKGLADLRNNKNTSLYRANYKEADPYTKNLQSIYSKIDGNAMDLGSDPNMSPYEKNNNNRISTRFSNSSLELEKANAAYADAKETSFAPFSGKDPNLIAASTNRDGARAAALFDAKQVLAIQTVNKAVAAYQKKLGDLDTQMTKVGLTFEDSPLFTAGKGSDTDSYGFAVDRLQTRINELEQLVNASKRTKDAAGALANFLSVRDAKSSLVLDQRQGADMNTLNPDALATKSFDKAGVTFDAKSLSSLSPTFNLQLAYMAQALEKNKAKLNLKEYIIRDDMTSDEKTRIASMMAGVKAEIAKGADDINRVFIEKAFAAGTSSYQRNNMLKGMGVQTPDDVATYSSDDKLKEYQAKEAQLKIIEDSISNATVDPNISDDKYKAFKKQIAALRYELTTLAPVSKTAQASLERLATVNFSITSTQVSKIPADVLKSQLANADRMKVINDQLADPAGISLDTQKSLGAEQAKLRRQGDEASAKYIPRSFSDKLSAISSAGANIDLTSALKLPSGTVDQYTKIADQIAIMQRQASDMNLSSKQVEKLGVSYQVAVKQLRALTESSMDYGQQLTFVNAQFTDAKITPEEWGRMQDKQRVSLVKLAQETRNYSELLDESRSTDPVIAKKALDTIKANNKAALEMTTTRNSTKRGSDLLTKAGVTVSDTDYSQTKIASRPDLEAIAQKIITQTDQLDGLDAATRKVAEASLTDMRKSLVKGLAVATQSKGVDKLNKAGITITEDAYNTISDTRQKILDGYVDGITKQRGILADGGASEQARMTAQITIDQLQDKIGREITLYTMKKEDSPAYQAGITFAQNITQDVGDGISEILKGKETGRQALTHLADTFTNGIIDSFVGGLMNGITGKSGFIQKTLASLTSGIFDMASGLFGADPQKSEKDLLTSATIDATAATRALTAALGGTPDALAGVLPGGAGTGLDASGMAIAGKSDPTYDATALRMGVTTLGGTLSASNITLGSVLSLGIKTMGGSLGVALQGLASVLGVSGGSSSGGLLGTLVSTGLSLFSGSSGGFTSSATSDALLSSVSAGTLSSGTSALTNLDWMDGIKTTGSYAVGGIIPGARGMPKPIMAHGGEVILNAAQQNALLHGGAGKSEQAFNISVTGDISRQTRYEIQKMIPQIASGVNQHNYENGKSS